MTTISTDAADAFIAKWSGVTASELSTAQSFALDLCRLLGVASPHPDAEQQYMFERPVTFTHGGRCPYFLRAGSIDAGQSTGDVSADDASTAGRPRACRLYSTP